MFAVRIVASPPATTGPTTRPSGATRSCVVRARGDRAVRRLGRVGAFGRGDLLWLEGVPLRALHNPGAEPAVLVAVSR